MGRGTGLYKSILVTLDGSSYSEEVLAEVSRLVEGCDATVSLLRVAPVPGTTSVESPRERLFVAGPAPGATAQVPAPKLVESKDQAIDRLTEEIHQYLESTVGDLRGGNVEVRTVVRFGSPANEIVRFAAAEGVDVVAMATHGQTGLARIILGSVALDVLKCRVAPVLLVRPRNLQSD